MWGTCRLRLRLFEMPNNVRNTSWKTSHTLLKGSLSKAGEIIDENKEFWLGSFDLSLAWLTLTLQSFKGWASNFAPLGQGLLGGSWTRLRSVRRLTRQVRTVVFLHCLQLGWKFNIDTAGT